MGSLTTLKERFLEACPVQRQISQEGLNLQKRNRLQTPSSQLLTYWPEPTGCSSLCSWEWRWEFVSDNTAAVRVFSRIKLIWTAGTGTRAAFRGSKIPIHSCISELLLFYFCLSAFSPQGMGEVYAANCITCADVRRRWIVCNIYLTYFVHFLPLDKWNSTLEASNFPGNKSS